MNTILFFKNITCRLAVPRLGLTVAGLVLALAGAQAIAADFDGDGIEDNQDNCIEIANGTTIPDAGGNSQRDTDGDGYGNVCDTDINQPNDGITNSLDTGVLKQQFLTVGPDADFNGDGVVNSLDTGVLKQYFLSPPGPSCVDLLPDGCQAPPNNPPTAVDQTFPIDTAVLDVAGPDGVLGNAEVPYPGVLLNASDPDGDTLTASLVGDVADGTLVLSSDGSFTYTPNAGTTTTASTTRRMMVMGGSAAFRQSLSRSTPVWWSTPPPRTSSTSC